MNEVQKVFARIIIPKNIEYIKNHIPELHHKIPELEAQLESINIQKLGSKEVKTC